MEMKEKNREGKRKEMKKVTHVPERIAYLGIFEGRRVYPQFELRSYCV